MVIKTTPQILKRISMRWLPYPAFENTDTIALNVGGYFMDLRIVTEDNSLEWSRAGERKELRRDPLTCQWTRIIDSLGSSDVDEAAFRTLPNGDDLEFGTFSMGGLPTAYEEIWRDVTQEQAGDGTSWILESSDGTAFLGKVGNVFLGMSQKEAASFVVWKEILNNGEWESVFHSGVVAGFPTATDTVQAIVSAGQGRQAGKVINVKNAEFVLRGLGQI